ncbi:MAG: aldehyde dehydrogenase family protein [Myxococcota bacterium]
MLNDSYPFYIAGKPETPNRDIEVTDKYRGEVATRVARASKDDLNRAIDAAVAATKPMRNLKGYQRRDVLMHCVTRCQERAEELSLCLTIEAGKALKDSRGEVQRLIDTFRIAAEESVRVGGEVLPLDISDRGAQWQGMWKRVPIGPCAFITPFNFPLNLVAHKVAPALALGCPFVLKPALRTPVSAMVLGEILAETNLPTGAFSIVTTENEDSGALVDDERLRFLSFTGSEKVGWMLKSQARKKKVTLELGGNAAVIVDRDADLIDAIDRIITGIFYQSGQSCISVQRIFVHSDLYDAFRDGLVEKTRELVTGDPQDEKTFIGPVISEGDAKRIVAWVQEAVDAGATVLCGGGRDGVMVEPTLLEGMPSGDLKLREEEVFGPVAYLERFDEFDAVIETINESRFGIHAGIFTRDLYRAMQAWDELEVGGVLVGDSSSFRIDNMPYGGVKSSGVGREGVRFAIEDMSEVRMLAIRDAGRSP